MTRLPPPDPAPRPAAPGQHWAPMLLNAEWNWMQCHLEGLERVLWLSPCLLPAVAAPSAALVLTAAGPALTGDVRTTSSAWPLRDDSLDGVVLQHPLEAGLPLDALYAEAMRVLKPEAMLWVIASGSASLCRFRLASAIGAGVRWPAAFRGSAFVASLTRCGAVDLALRSLAFDNQSGALSSMSRALPWAPVVLAQARKRRSASILRPRALRSLAGPNVSNLPALPASRVGIAA